MKQCYLCGLEFNETTVKEHKEHVIQQAIGGSLTASSILCEGCGSKLNDDIDKNFTKIFENTSVLLGIKRDRKRIDKITIRGRHQAFNSKIQKILVDKNIQAVWSNGKVYPSRPFEVYSDDRKVITIYSNPKTAKDYKKKVEANFSKQYPNLPLPKVEVCDDLNGITSFNFNLNNNVFKQGLAKIAVNYASYCDVPREQINMVLKIDGSTKTANFNQEPSVMFFYPLGIIDKLIEDKKSQFEPYPTHTIILFTSPSTPNLLICYIELFSTYQYYVVLSDNYEGSRLYKFYTQKILPEKETVFEPYRSYYKDRSYILASLNITEEERNSAYISHKDEDKEIVEAKLITRKQNEQKYDISLERYLEDIINLTMLEKIREIDEKPDSSNLSQINELLLNKNLFFYCNADDEYIFNIESYRRYYINAEGVAVDYIHELFENYKSMSDEIKAHNYKKFYDLENFSNNRNLKKKLDD